MAGGPPVGIVSTSRDFHAHAVRDLLDRWGVACHLVPVDRLSGAEHTFRDAAGGARLITDRAGAPVDPGDLGTLWWRRAGAPQQLADRSEPVHAELVDNDTREALRGALLTTFAGRWVSHPAATDLAENKLLQLQQAARAGLTVPDTRVTQDPAVVEELLAAHPEGVVVKWVRGVHATGVPAKRLRPELVGRLARQIRLAPAIYQELVPGRSHLRVTCFGDEPPVAVEIRSDDLDWRTDMNLDVRPVRTPPELGAKLQLLLKALDLRMGMVDLKLTPEGECYFLEVNPQGQFLFLDGLCPGLDLLPRFCSFLTSNA